MTLRQSVAMYAGGTNSHGQVKLHLYRYDNDELREARRVIERDCHVTRRSKRCQTVKLPQRRPRTYVPVGRTRSSSVRPKWAVIQRRRDHATTFYRGSNTALLTHHHTPRYVVCRRQWRLQHQPRAALET